MVFIIMTVIFVLFIIIQNNIKCSETKPYKFGEMSGKFDNINSYEEFIQCTKTVDKQDKHH